MSRGPWDEARTARFLEDARIPIRLACNGTDGHPVVASLWFAPFEGRLWCATQRDAHVAELLRRDPRCAFEVAGDAPPYRGVRGRARASLEPGRAKEMLERLIDRYLDSADDPLARWLLSRVESEVAIGLEPHDLSSWDYSGRMRGG